MGIHRSHQKGVPTVLCSQAEMQALIHQDAVLSLLLLFIIKIIGPYGIGHTTCLLTHLPQFCVPLNSLIKNTQTSLIHHKTLCQSIKPRLNSS